MVTPNFKENMTDSTTALPATAAKHAYLFRKSLPMQLKLHETLKSLGSTEGESCLDIGAENGMLCHYLRRHGGHWNTVAVTEAVAAAVREVVTGEVDVLKDMTLPFKKQTFDAVVIMGGLETFPADHMFIEECHRVLKPDGRLILNAYHVKAWTFINVLRRVMGLTHERKGMVRPGYTESQLFSILKHGFDVHTMRSYSRFFVECTDVLAQFLCARTARSAEAGEKGVRRIHSFFSPLFWLAFQFDLLIFFTRGHRLIAQAKRRSWRPRNAPVLVDGRSISEAVLSKTAE